MQAEAAVMSESEEIGPIGGALEPALHPGHEFSDSENELLGDLSHKMGCVGCLSTVIGSLYLIYGLMALTFWIMMALFTPLGTEKVAGILVGGLLVLVMATATFIFVGSGLWLRRSAASFQAVVKTQGRDIPLVLEACQQLTKLYKLWSFLLATALLIMVLAFSIAPLAAVFR